MIKNIITQEREIIVAKSKKDLLNYMNEYFPEAFDMCLYFKTLPFDGIDDNGTPIVRYKFNLASLETDALDLTPYVKFLAAISINQENKEPDTDEPMPHITLTGSTESSETFCMGYEIYEGYYYEISYLPSRGDKIPVPTPSIDNLGIYKLITMPTICLSLTDMEDVHFTIVSTGLDKTIITGIQKTIYKLYELYNLRWNIIDNPNKVDDQDLNQHLKADNRILLFDEKGNQIMEVHVMIPRKLADTDVNRLMYHNHTEEVARALHVYLKTNAPQYNSYSIDNMYKKEYVCHSQ